VNRISGVLSTISILSLKVDSPPTSKALFKSTAPLIVVIPDMATLPLAKRVVADPTFIFPLPPVLSTCISPTISSMFVLVLKSRLPSVTSSPAAPARTMPCCVRSLTCAELATKPPVIFAPPFASIAPLIVVIPDMATLPLAKIVAPIPRVPPKFA